MILLACTRLSPTTLYPGTAALLPTLGAALVIGAGCAAPAQGCGRVLALPPMRAIGRISYSWYLWHWPVLVLAPALLGHPLGLAAQAGSGPALRRAGRADPALHREPAAIRRSDAPVCPGAVSRSAVPPPRSRSVWAWRCCMCPSRSAAAPAAAPLTVTAAAVPPGSDIDAYDAAVQHAFAQVQAAVAASADLKAVPSNLNPPLADACSRARAMSPQRLPAHILEVGQPECATGDTASTTTVALVGDSHAAMWIRRSSRSPRSGTGGWRRWPRAPARCWTCPSSTHLSRLVEHFECEQWRGQIIARLQAEHPRLVVLSMYAAATVPAAGCQVSRHTTRRGSTA